MAGQGMARAWQGGSHEPSSSTTLPYPTLSYKVPYPSAFGQGREGGINSEVLARNKGEEGKYGFFCLLSVGKYIPGSSRQRCEREKKKTMCKITETSLALA